MKAEEVHSLWEQTALQGCVTPLLPLFLQWARPAGVGHLSSGTLRAEVQGFFCLFFFPVG